jgi:hypothetical protein
MDVDEDVLIATVTYVEDMKRYQNLVMDEYVKLLEWRQGEHIRYRDLWSIVHDACFSLQISYIDIHKGDRLHWEKVLGIYYRRQRLEKKGWEDTFWYKGKMYYGKHRHYDTSYLRNFIRDKAGKLVEGFLFRCQKRLDELEIEFEQ